MPYHFTRTGLYNSVWTEPMRTVAQRTGISDVALSKLCRRHDVPIPPRGHWAKVAAGKKTHRPHLPRRGLGMPEEISSDKHLSHPLDAENPETIAIPPPPAFDEPISGVVLRVQQLVGTVVAAKSLEKTHGVISQALEADHVRREKQAVSRYATWDAPLFESPFEKRRLRILNAIFLALERCGARPSVRGKEYVEASVRVGECWISFTLDDPKQKPGEYRPRSDPKRAASDRLELRISYPAYADGFARSWLDERDASLETRLSEIVTTCLVIAETAYRFHVTHQHEWLVKRKAELIDRKRERLELERRKVQERLEGVRRARVDRLLSEASALRQANDIRNYIEAVRLSELRVDRVEAWAAWAHSVADSIDPVLLRTYEVSMEDDTSGAGTAASCDPV